jgi:hypothetical protein
MNTSEPLEKTAQELEESISRLPKEASRRLATLNAEVTAYIRANPGTCLLGALATGYIIGSIARRM